jgi:hypothetical protein
LDLSDLAHLVVVVLLLVLAHVVVEAPPLDLAALADLAHVVLEAAQVLQLPRSRSFSASTARICPSPVQPTYERAPSTR